ncbi:unnamed protein product [Peniophora sp. CBMAI 1063]|nr:unnamed protein product [Peniophora sp. CBMAI 1063]
MPPFSVEPFVCARLDFLRAVTTGPDAVLSFYRSWSTCVQELHEAHRQGLVPPDALRVVSNAVRDMDVLASCFSETEENAQDLLSSLLEKSSLTNDHPKPEPYLSNWILLHLDSPYPDEDEVDRIAAATSTTTKWVNNWFIKARRAIGWDALLQLSFTDDIVSASRAARHVYFGEEGTAACIPTHIVMEFLRIEREAEKMRETAIATVLSDYGCGEFHLFAEEEEEEDMTPAPAVAGAKRRRPDEEDEIGSHKRVRSSPSMCTARRPRVATRRDVSTSSNSAPSIRCTFTLPTGQTLDVNALNATTSSSRKRRASDTDDDGAAHISKRARRTLIDASTSSPSGQQSLSDILTAPLGTMLPPDIDVWASNISPATDFSLDWMHGPFNALAPPSGDVSLSTIDWNNPDIFSIIDPADHAIDTIFSPDNALTSSSPLMSTPSSPRSVTDSLSGSDTSLESLSPVVGRDTALDDISNTVLFGWDTLPPVQPVDPMQIPEGAAKGKVGIHVPWFHADTVVTPSEYPFEPEYGDWTAPQIFTASY